MTDRAVPDAAIVAVIRAQTAARAPGSISPSEVARALAADWRPLMGRIRALAAALPEVEATRRGIPVAPESATGPIRLRRAAAPNAGQAAPRRAGPG